MADEGSLGGPVVYRGSGMETLADILIGKIAREQSGRNPFYKTRVVISNKSMARFLTQRFAERVGIEAGIEYPFLMSLFSRQRLKPAGATAAENTSSAPEIDAGTIAWRILRILRETEGLPEFSHLTEWTGGDPVRRYELALQLGRLYNKYLLYRPDWINAWESGDDTAAGLPRGRKDVAWQGRMWRLTAGEDWKGRHFAAVWREIKSGDLVPKSPEPIRIFGFSAIPPAVLECLEMFGRRQPVELYQLTPSNAFYGDSKPPKTELREFVKLYCGEDVNDEQLRTILSEYYFQHNPLVASFAAQSRTLLNGTIDWQEKTAGADADEFPADTALHRMQSAIRLDRKASSSPDPSSKKGCRSIQIRDCYSEFREVEAAHNFVLHCLDEKPDLKLNDIFIMSPTPDKFAPLVDAVFNHSASGSRLPVSIADRSEAEDDPSFKAFLKILSLFRGSFTASDVFGIMQDRTVQGKLGITEDECEYCLERAMDAGIRWGWDAEDHRNEGGEAFPENSWQAGFDRMLLGYMLETAPETPYQAETGNDIFTVRGFEGSRAALLGKLESFAARLRDVAMEMRRLDRTGAAFSEWRTFLNRIVGDFFGADSDLAILLMPLFDRWEDALAAAGISGEPLTSGIILKQINAFSADGNDTTRGFLRGSITFCGLRPMRSIPARVIVLLGMSHTAFPVQEDKLSFDLTLANPRAGDPVRRDESRQLFLDVLLSARDYLYISYVGRNNHDRKEYPPSVCVSELRTYLQGEFGKDGFVDIREPLQAFSPELFAPGKPNQSYSGIMLQAMAAVRNSERDSARPRPLFDIGSCEPHAVSCEEEIQLSLDELIRFFLNPVKYYLSNRLDADVSVNEGVLADDSEAFRAGNTWPYKEEFLALCRETPGEEARSELKKNCLHLLQANALLPLTLKPDDWEEWNAMAVLADATPESGTVIPAARKTFEVRTEGQPVRRIALDLPEIRLSAEGTLRIPLLSSPKNGSTIIRVTLMHLAANLRGTGVETEMLVPANGKKVRGSPEPPPLIAKVERRASAMDAETAAGKMLALLQVYCEGLQSPLPFFPRTACAVFNGEAVQNAWRKADFYGRSDMKDFGAFFGTELPDAATRRLEELSELVFGLVEFTDAERK